MFDLFLHYNNCSIDIILENYWPLLNKQVPASLLTAYSKGSPMWEVPWLQINASNLDCPPCGFQRRVTYEATICFFWFTMAKHKYHEPLAALSSSEGWLPTSLTLSQESKSHKGNFPSMTETDNTKADNLKHTLHIWEKGIQAFFTWHVNRQVET